METDEKLAQQELIREQEIQQRRSEIEAKKEARKQRQQTKETLTRFLVKQNVVEKTCRMVDTQKVRDYESDKAAHSVGARKARWAHKSAILSEKPSFGRVS